MHGARKAKIAEELENFVEDFGFCRRFILTSNTFTCLFAFYLSFFFFFFHIFCREKFKHIFLKRQVKFVYTNICTSPIHKKSISGDSRPSLKPTYCPSSLGYSARILFTTHEGVTLLTSLSNLACTNQQNCL